MDSHTIGLGLELVELLDDDVCKQANSVGVGAVVEVESNKGKRDYSKIAIGLNMANLLTDRRFKYDFRTQKR